jgi:hypothetical protein
MFTRVKVINGKNYYYLVESKRDGDKVSQRVVRYLGTSRPSPSIMADILKVVKG